MLLYVYFDVWVCVCLQTVARLSLDANTRIASRKLDPVVWEAGSRRDREIGQGIIPANFKPSSPSNAMWNLHDSPDASLCILSEPIHSNGHLHLHRTALTHLRRVRLTIHQGDPQLVGRRARRQALAVSVVFEPSGARSWTLRFFKMHPGSDPHRGRENMEKWCDLFFLKLAIPNIPCFIVPLFQKVPLFIAL